MKFSKVKSIVKVESEPIYHLTVKKNHNFIANNLCVHNCDYRGELKVILHKTFNMFDFLEEQRRLEVQNNEMDNIHRWMEHNKFKIGRGDRIAQCVFARKSPTNLIKAVCLSETSRGTGGLGSTGVK